MKDAFILLEARSHIRENQAESMRLTPPCKSEICQIVRVEPIRVDLTEHRHSFSELKSAKQTVRTDLIFCPDSFSVRLRQYENRQALQQERLTLSPVS